MRWDRREADWKSEFVSRTGATSASLPRGLDHPEQAMRGSPPGWDLWPYLLWRTGAP